MSGNLHSPLILVCSRLVRAMRPLQPGQFRHFLSGTGSPGASSLRAASSRILSRTRARGSSSESPSGPAATSGYKCSAADCARLSTTGHVHCRPFVVGDVPIRIVRRMGVPVRRLEVSIKQLLRLQLATPGYRAISSIVACSHVRGVSRCRKMKARFLAIWCIARFRNRYQTYSIAL